MIDAPNTKIFGFSQICILCMKPNKNNVQWVQISDTHPESDGVMVVGKDGKLHPPKVIRRKKQPCRCRKNFASEEERSGRAL